MLGGVSAVLCAAALALPCLADLKETVSKEGGFKLKLPGTPKEQKIEAAGIQISMLVLPAANGAYVASHNAMPLTGLETEADLQKMLDGARDGALKNSGATLTKETKVTLGQSPGRDIRAEIPAKKGVMRLRVFVVGKKLLQVMAVGTPEFVNSDEATKAIESLELVPEKP